MGRTLILGLALVAGCTTPPHALEGTWHIEGLWEEASHSDCLVSDDPDYRMDIFVRSPAVAALGEQWGGYRNVYTGEFDTDGTALLTATGGDGERTFDISLWLPAVEQGIDSFQGLWSSPGSEDPDCVQQVPMMFQRYYGGDDAL